LKQRRSAGAAILLAMLLAALAATIAVTLFADQQRWTRAVMHRRDQAQAQALAMAGVQWARQVLYDDVRRGSVDHLKEPWAIALPPIPLENGEIRGGIADAQARLNINALGDKGTATALERARIGRLVASLPDFANALDAIGDWIDADVELRPNGAEDAYYGSLPVPRIAANAPIGRIAELGAVKGVSLTSLAAISPFITALPLGTPVNVNTAPPEVIAAIVENLSSEGLAAFVAKRDKAPFSSLSDFRAALPPTATLSDASLLDVKSNWFYVTVEARQGTTIARARALVNRGADTSKWPTVAWQVVE
jgi:general secretion pathway protein K